MKKVIIVLILLSLFFALIPLLALGDSSENNAKNKDAPITTTTKKTAKKISDEEKTVEKDKDNLTEEKLTERITTATQAKSEKESLIKENSGIFKLYDASRKEVIEVSDLEFCYGALAVAMDTSWEKEALKAQTIALYSYYCNLREIAKKNPDDKLNGADFEVNCKIWKVYVPKEELKDKWNSTFEESYKIITDTVNSVFKDALTYNNKAAKTIFHAISSGVTENYSEIYNEDISYLTSVSSPFDKTVNNYSTTVEYTYDEFVETAKSTWKDFECDSNPNKVIGETTYTAANSVKTIKIGNKELTGKKVMEAFGLRSLNFEVLYTQDKFIFTVKGYGDNIGMSQFGANEMAKQGSTYKEILSHYYPSCILTENYKTA